MRFDKKDYPDVCLDVVTGSASSGRRVKERTVEITDKIKGKIMDTRQIALSPDLKTLMTAHRAGQKQYARKSATENFLGAIRGH